MRPDIEAGSVTAETAVALPALVLVVVLGGWLLAAVAAEVRCVDAAREGARAIARGDPTSLAVTVAARAAPRGAHVTVRREGGEVVVEVRARVGTTVGPAVGVRVGATARAPAEDQVGDVSDAQP
jgi:TadE-like protein